MPIEVRIEAEGASPIEYLFESTDFVFGCHPFNQLSIDGEGISLRHGRIFGGRAALV